MNRWPEMAPHQHGLPLLYEEGGGGGGAIFRAALPSAAHIVSEFDPRSSAEIRNLKSLNQGCPMSPVALVRDLSMHLRAWERHRVRFGIVCSRKRLTLCRPLFTAACTGVSAADAPSLQNEPGMALSIIVPDDSLVYRFPYGYDKPRWRGKRNPRFLNSNRLSRALHAIPVPVERVILPLSQIYRTEGVALCALAQQMKVFFDSLPNSFSYALEIQNSDYLLPAYFDLLASHAVAHVLNDSAVMPSLLDQIQTPQVLTADRVIVRTTASCTPEWKLGILETVRRCVSEKKELSVYMADTESMTVESALSGVLELLSPDLARLSPLRRRAA